MSQIRDLAVELAKEKKYDEAFCLLREAISQGDIYAINDLGVICEEIGDYAEAYRAYEYLIQFDCGVAAHNIGNFYEQGIYVEQDYSKAIEYYQKAFEWKYGYGAYKLSEMYRWGRGVKKDEVKAFNILKEASKFSTGCMCQLGYYYAYGIGAKKDYNKYFKCTEQAAMKEDTVAIYNLGECYLLGLGCDKDIDKALKCYNYSAEKKYPDAFYTLGCIYDTDEYGLKNKTLSDYYYWKSIDLRSLKGLIRGARTYLSRDYDKQKNLTFAINCLQEFLKLISEQDEFELRQYKKLKKDFKDDINWELLEMDPTNYFQNINKKLS